MITDVVFQYLDDVNKSGGRPKIVKEIPSKVFFNPSVDISTTKGQRLWDMGIRATADVVLESALDPLEEDKVDMLHVASGKIYRLFKIVAATSDLGLDGAYQLLLGQGISKDD